MKKKVFPLALVALSFLLLDYSANADTISLIEFGANNSLGNGSLFTDTPGVANQTVDGDSVDTTVMGINGPSIGTGGANSGGRALVNAGGDQDSFLDAGNISDVADLLDNSGVAITGFSVFRSFLPGGNPAFGYVEDTVTGLNNSAAGGSSGDFNGSAFANGGDFVLVSDAISFGGTSADTFDIGVQAGTTGGAPIGLTTFLIFDDAAALTVNTQVITGLPDADADGSVDRVEFADVLAGTGFSTVRVAFLVQSPGGNRGLLDDVSFSVTTAVPEPSSLALIGVVGLVAVARRRR